MPKKSFYVYIVRCRDGTLYTGFTTDVAGRVTTHNTSPRGAKYTRARRPVTLVYSEKFTSRSLALKREVAIKRLSRAKKEALFGD
jgi:putative endonuclease